jgi:AcrR family transcriptional regulator
VPRSATQNELLKEERRAEILRAALSVFARQGLAATKISDIAEAAGISHGLVYHYFPTKEAIYTALVERAAQGGLRTTEEALAHSSAASPWERLRTLCEVMVTGIQTQPEYLMIMLQVGTPNALPGGARRALVQYARQTVANLAALIREGQEAGQVVAGDPVELAKALLATINGLALLRALEAVNPQPPVSPATVLRLLQA